MNEVSSANHRVPDEGNGNCNHGRWNRMPEDAAPLSCDVLKYDESPSGATFDLYIGDLPKDATEAEFLSKFSTFGKVEEVIIKRAKFTKVILGYGFVKYATEAGAEQALLAFSTPPTASTGDTTDAAAARTGPFTTIRVSWAQKNCRIHVGNLHSSVSAAELNDLFRPHGSVLEQATHVHLSGSNRDSSFGEVLFEFHADADRARGALNGHLLRHRPMYLEWYQSTPLTSISKLMAANAVASSNSRRQYRRVRQQLQQQQMPQHTRYYHQPHQYQNHQYQQGYQGQRPCDQDFAAYAGDFGGSDQATGYYCPQHEPQHQQYPAQFHSHGSMQHGTSGPGYHHNSFGPDADTPYPHQCLHHPQPHTGAVTQLPYSSGASTPKMGNGSGFAPSHAHHHHQQHQYHQHHHHQQQFCQPRPPVTVDDCYFAGGAVEQEDGCVYYTAGPGGCYSPAVSGDRCTPSPQGYYTPNAGYATSTGTGTGNCPEPMPASLPQYSNSHAHSQAHSQVNSRSSSAPPTPADAAEYDAYSTGNKQPVELLPCVRPNQGHIQDQNSFQEGGQQVAYFHPYENPQRQQQALRVQWDGEMYHSAASAGPVSVQSGACDGHAAGDVPYRAAYQDARGPTSAGCTPYPRDFSCHTPYPTPSVSRVGSMRADNHAEAASPPISDVTECERNKSCDSHDSDSGGDDGGPNTQLLSPSLQHCKQRSSSGISSLPQLVMNSPGIMSPVALSPGQLDPDGLHASAAPAAAPSTRSFSAPASTGRQYVVVPQYAPPIAAPSTYSHPPNSLGSQRTAATTVGPRLPFGVIVSVHVKFKSLRKYTPVGTDGGTDDRIVSANSPSASCDSTAGAHAPAPVPVAVVEGEEDRLPLSPSNPRTEPAAMPPSTLLVDEKTIASVFAKYGRVAAVSIKQSTVEPSDGKQRGYAFVHFESSEGGRMAARRAVQAVGYRSAAAAGTDGHKWRKNNSNRNTPSAAATFGSNREPSPGLDTVKGGIIVDHVHYTAELSKNFQRGLWISHDRGGRGGRGSGRLINNDAGKYSGVQASYPYHQQSHHPMQHHPYWEAGAGQYSPFDAQLGGDMHQQWDANGQSYSPQNPQCSQQSPQYPQCFETHWQSDEQDPQAHLHSQHQSGPGDYYCGTEGAVLPSCGVQFFGRGSGTEAGTSTGAGEGCGVRDGQTGQSDHSSHSRE